MEGLNGRRQGKQRFNDIEALHQAAETVLERYRVAGMYIPPCDQFRKYSK